MAENLLGELKRRKVFKVGAAYLVVAWLAVQGASIGFPAFDAQASPSERPPLRLFNGSEDGIVPPAHAAGFVAQARAKHEDIEYTPIW